jgi:hypothetical protein
MAFAGSLDASIDGGQGFGVNLDAFGCGDFHLKVNHTLQYPRIGGQCNGPVEDIPVKLDTISLNP